jgi:hypothetical protein
MSYAAGLGLSALAGRVVRPGPCRPGLIQRSKSESQRAGTLVSQDMLSRRGNINTLEAGGR